MAEGLVVLVLLAAGWVWLDAMRARETATVVAKRLCAEAGVQFLDDTVAIARLGLGRHGGGTLSIRRTYSFEFSDTGDNRRAGSVTLLGGRLEATHMEPHRFEPPQPPLESIKVVEIRQWRGSE